jgi:NTE family protein
VAAASRVACLLALWLAVLLADAARAAPPASPDRPRIGLVLSGGGARGISHIGVLRVLERLRIPIDYIAGTSMGGIVGGAYASGVTAEEMERWVLETDWRSMFSDAPDRRVQTIGSKIDDRKQLFSPEFGIRDGALTLPQGVVGGMKQAALLRLLTGTDTEHFDELPIPFRAVATDLETGEVVVLERGDLPRALRATMSIPGAFAPVEIDGRLLVDGGLVRNLPVDVVRRMGAEIVIAVNIGTPLFKRDALGSVLGVSWQMLNILTEQNVQAQIASLGSADVLISPDLRDVSLVDFERAREAIAIGEAATEAASERLRPLGISGEAWAQHRARRPAAPRPPEPVDFVRIEGLQRVAPGYARSVIDTRPGSAPDDLALEADAFRLVGTGNFENVTPRLVREAGRRGAVFEASEKPWGPHFLRFGLGLSSDSKGNAAFQMLALHRLTWVNALGGQWRNEVEIGKRRRLLTEFQQPLDEAGTFFVAPRFGIEQDRRALFDGAQRIAEFGFRATDLGLDAGITFGRWGEARIGLVHSKVKIREDVGTTGSAPPPVNRSGLQASLTLDQIDNLNFPQSGAAALASLHAARRELGAGLDYGRALVDGVAATTIGRQTFTLSARFGGAIGEDGLPSYERFALGGFGELSGYQSDELSGAYLALLRLSTYRRIADLTRPLGTGLYAGASLEAGNAWAAREDVSLSDLRIGASVFLGFDTFLGPLYLSLGVADGGRNAAYLFLGRP